MGGCAWHEWCEHRGRVQVDAVLGHEVVTQHEDVAARDTHHHAAAAPRVVDGQAHDDHVGGLGHLPEVVYLVPYGIEQTADLAEERTELPLSDHGCAVAEIGDDIVGQQSEDGLGITPVQCDQDRADGFDPGRQFAHTHRDRPSHRRSERPRYE